MAACFCRYFAVNQDVIELHPPGGFIKELASSINLPEEKSNLRAAL